MSRVALGREQLRILLSRRTFVGAGVVAAAGVLGLGACSSGNDDGGNSGGGGGAGTRSITGTIALPAGSTLTASALTVDVGGTATGVSSSPGFSATVADSGPSLALLQDRSGNVVLMAMIDPANSASWTISSDSTAQAALFLAIGAWSLPGDIMSQALGLIAADPATAALGTTIAAAVAADPDALSSNASIGDALLAATREISSSSVRQPVAAERDDQPTLLLINPADAQSGIRVDQQNSTTSLVISNSKRRASRVYVYAVTTLTAGQTQEIKPAKRIAGVIDLPATQSLNAAHSLRDLVALIHNPGSAAQTQWQPVTLDPIALSLESGSDRTAFQVIVVNAAFKSLAQDTFEPPAYRDDHFTTQVAQWRTDETTLLFRSLLGDVVFPLVCFLGGLGAMNAGQSALDGVVDGIAAERSAAFTRIINQLSYGSLGSVDEALAGMVQLALTSDVSTLFRRADVQSVLGQAVAKATSLTTPSALTARLTGAGRTFLAVLRPLFAAGAVLQGIDVAAVLSDLVTSDVADTWTALLIKQNLNLKPQSPRITPGERVSFTVSNPQNTTGDISYVWTQTSPFAQFSAVGEANVGATITTKQLAVDLVTTGSDTTPITVTVIGYDTSSGQQVEIGRSQTTVSFLLVAQITPSSPALDVGDQKIFVVTVDGTLPSGVTYKWTLTGGSGTIGSGSVVTTQAPQITYTGVNHGNDTLHVDVLDQNGGLVAKADVAILVAPPASIDFTVAGAWPSYVPMRLGTFHFTSNLCERVPSPTVPGCDIIAFNYNIAPDGSAGVMMAMLIPTGSDPFSGQRFLYDIHNASQEVRAGAFAILVAWDQDHVNGADNITGDTGQIVFDTVGKLSDGTTVVQFSFSTVAEEGGTVTGKGVARF